MNQALVFVLVSAFFVGTRCLPQEPMTEKPQAMSTTIMSAPVDTTSNSVTGKNGTSSMAPQASTRSPTDMNLQVVTSTAASETTGSSSSSSESHEGRGKGKGKGKRHNQKDHHHGSNKNKRSARNPSADQMKKKSKKKASTKTTTESTPS